MRNIALFFTGLFFILLLATGCGDQNTGEQKEETAETSSQKAEDIPPEMITSAAKMEQAELKKITVDLGVEGGMEKTFAIKGTAYDPVLHFLPYEGMPDLHQLAEGRVNNVEFVLENYPELDPEKTGAVVTWKNREGKVSYTSLSDTAGVSAMMDERLAATNNPQPEKGNEMKKVIRGNGYSFFIETSKTEQISGRPWNYLYIKYDLYNKMKVAESTDRGEDWTNSVAGIENAVLGDNGRVYYETDNAFVRTNGVGAQSHMTRVAWYDGYDLIDKGFAMGAITNLLGEDEGGFEGCLLLETPSRDNEGEVVPFYMLYTPEGERIIRLGYDLEDDLLLQINKTILEKTGVEGDPEKMNREKREETIHGQHIVYNYFWVVAIENYPVEDGILDLDVMEYTNPLYPEAPYAEYNVAIKGTVYDVYLDSRPNMDTGSSHYDITDKLFDTLIKGQTRFPADGAFDAIYFKPSPESNRDYRVVIDDMSDWMDIVKIPYEQ